MAPAPGCDPGGGGCVCAAVSSGVSLAATARAGRRNLSRRGGSSGDWIPAGNFRGPAAEDQRVVGAGDDRAGGAGSGVCRRFAFSHHGSVAVWVVASDASLHRWTSAACGAEAVLDFERAAGGVAGADQLQPLFVAAVVCVRRSSPAVVFRVVGGGAGECVLLFGRAADVAGAGEEGCGAEGGGRVGCRGLKPCATGAEAHLRSALYAALK